MSEVRLFADRRDAGQQLAEALQKYTNRDDVVVLGLPRGGVPIAYEVAIRLNVPLDVLVVRKLGTPGHEEMAMGAISRDGVRILNQELVENLGIPEEVITSVEERERRELQRRETIYRGNHAMLQLEGKTVLLVDDGLATGATMQAALLALTQYHPAQIIVAVPVASREVCDEFQHMDEVDDVFCVLAPVNFHAVGFWYRNFTQTSDDEVRRLLQQSREQSHSK